MRRAQPHSFNVHVTGRRIVSTIIDSAVLGVILSVSAEALNIDLPLRTPNGTTASFTGAALAVLVVLAYYTVLEGLFGRTIGKLLTGIRVVGENGNRPGLASALVRTLLRLIDGIFGYLLGFIVVISSSRRRRLGDMAAKTLVVRN